MLTGRLGEESRVLVVFGCEIDRGAVARGVSMVASTWWLLT